MIRSFGNALAEAAWQRRFVKGVPGDIMKAAHHKLTQIENARRLDDLRAPPGNRLEALCGDRKGSTACGSTTSGGPASAGAMAMRSTSRLSTITEDS